MIAMAMMRGLRLCLQLGVTAWIVVITVALATSAVWAQDNPHERVFPQSKATVEKVLQTLQPNLAGHLPTLEGFAIAGTGALERYQRGYYQTSMQVTAMADGSSLVRATSKVTAWYSDPAGFHSGYQLLTSNGRIEEDALDQLADQLGRLSGASNRDASGTVSKSPAEPPATTSATSSHPADAVGRAASVATAVPTSNPVPPPQPAGSDISAPSDVSRSEEFAAATNPALGAAERANVHDPNPSASGAEPSRTVHVKTDRLDPALQAEAESLEEILKNQAHPNNLVAVKKSGTAVVSTPSLAAKPLFMASMHDEFELLDFNRDWVHVRISGLSRGWIWRNSVEMPNGIADTVVENGPAPAAAAELFHVVREETSPFPGDWEPLRGKTVKIFSVQKADENAKDASSTERLAYAKFLFDKSYREITQKAAAQKTPAPGGIVLIFDSADGGMIAATLSALQEWKRGTLSDSALWHKCFFDPPETFDSTGNSGSR